MTSLIKKEMSDSFIPLISPVKKEHSQQGIHETYSTQTDDGEIEHNKTQVEDDTHQDDDFFKLENTSVDLFLQEIKSSSNVDLNLASLNTKKDRKHISPTKPLNLKNANSSRTSLHAVLEEQNKSPQAAQQADGFIQDIPISPPAPAPPTTSAMKLKGPRAVYQTPNKKSSMASLNKKNTPDMSPSRKSVFIDASPPRVMEFTAMSEEEEEEEEPEQRENDAEDQLNSAWKQLTPRRKSNASSPAIQRLSPEKSIEYTEEQETDPSINLTMEDIQSIKKMTMEEKLNAVINLSDPATRMVEYDHDRYLEDAKFQRTKSVAKRNSYYDDMLLNSIKNKKKSNGEDLEEYDGLTDLYDTDIRNTKSNRSLKLDLNRSNSIQSQISIASGERILETTTSPAKVQEQDQYSDLSSNNNSNNDDQTETEVEPEAPASQAFEVEQVVEKEEATPATPRKVSHSRQSSLTEKLSPYKMGQYLANGLRNIVNPQDVAEEMEKEKQALAIEPESANTSTEDFFQSAQASENSSSDDSDLIQQHQQKQAQEAQQAEHQIQEDNDGDDMMGNSTEIADLTTTRAEQVQVTSSSDSAEDEEEGSTTLENSDSPSMVEISKEEFQIGALNEDDDSNGHSLSLELDQHNNENSTTEEIKQEQVEVEEILESQQETPKFRDYEEEFQQDSDFITPPKKALSDVSSSPQCEVLSIWQSQSEYKHVPKHKITRCSSMVSANSASQNKRATMTARLGSNGTRTQQHQPPKIHVVSARVVSEEIVDDSEHDMLPNISGDSDFASDFKDFGITLEKQQEEQEEAHGGDENAAGGDDDDDDDNEVFHDSQELITQEDNKTIRNIWRSGTIRDTKKLDPLPTEDVHVFSDEDHEVKNVRSKVTVKTPDYLQHKQHQASVEVIKDNQTIYDETTMNTSIPTVQQHEVSVLANLSDDYDQEHHQPSLIVEKRPLGEVSSSILNSMANRDILNEDMDKVTPASAPLPLPKQITEEGRLFLRLNNIAKLDLPDLSHRKAEFCCILDNGLHRIQTEYFKMGDKINIDKEFELIKASSETLKIVLTFKAKYDKVTDTLVEVQEREVVPSKSFFGKLFKNKHIITRTKFVNKPAPNDQWEHILSPDGTFAKVTILLTNFEKQILGQAQNYKLALINDWNRKNYNQVYQIGIIDLTMLYLPRISNHEILPNSISQAYEELTQIDEQQRVYYQGYLFQEGGDCKMMKRRFFKLENGYLIAHNEDTMKLRCRINLFKVIEIIYLNEAPESAVAAPAPAPALAAASQYRNFSDNLWTNGFKLKFANGEIIEFNAQDRYERGEWLNCLSNVVNKNNFARQPWVKLMHQKMSSSS